MSSSPFFTHRLSHVSLGENDWTRSVSEARGAGPLLDLTISNPLRVFPERDWSAVRHALAHVRLDAYAPCGLGALPAREALAEYLRSPAAPPSSGFVDLGRGLECRAPTLMLTASTSESYSHLFKLLTKPGDRVLVPSPSYPLLEHLVALESLEVVPYELCYDGAWYVDLDSFRRGLQRKPAVAIVVTPNNPTGSCLSAGEFAELVASDVPLIIDQVFAPYCRERTDCGALSFEQTPGLVFVLDGLSKRCALPQLKLGWLAAFGPGQRVAAAMDALELIGDTYLGVNSVTEGALGALLQQSAGFRETICKRLATNLETLRRVSQTEALFSVLHYQGGWSIMLRLPSHTSDEAWSRQLLEAGVLVQPGWLYDCPTPATCVLSLLTPEDIFAEGVRRLRDVTERAD